jgi:Na+/pantothenate symporter
MLNNLKNKVMKNMFALMLVCAMMATACSTNESTTTEATTESVDSLYQDTVDLGGSVDTAAVAQ